MSKLQYGVNGPKRKFRNSTHTATCVVYCVLDWILKEFLPGPEELSTVVLSARNVTWLPDTETSPPACAVACVT